MKINEENYEGYLMRYADGELDADERAEVEQFLAAHPALRDELDELTDPSLRVTAPEVTMPHKERLLHQPFWQRPAFRAAAAIVLVLGATMLIWRGQRGAHEVVVAQEQETTTLDTSVSADSVAPAVAPATFVVASADEAELPTPSAPAAVPVATKQEATIVDHQNEFDASIEAASAAHVAITESDTTLTPIPAATQQQMLNEVPLIAESEVADSVAAPDSATLKQEKKQATHTTRRQSRARTIEGSRVNDGSNGVIFGIQGADKRGIKGKIRSKKQ